MHAEHSIDRIICERVSRGEFSPAARSVAERLLTGRSALLVAPDPAEREEAWQRAVSAGCLPVLVIAPSDTHLARRRDDCAADLDLIACHIHAQLTDGALETLSEQLAACKWDTAFVSGRSLSDPRIMHAARALAPRLLVIEAAHRLSARDHEYDISWLSAAELAGSAESVLALSDVAGADIRTDILRQLDLCESQVVFSGLDRPDLRLEVRRTPNQPQKDALLLGLFRKLPHRAVVYVNEQVEAERLAALIRDERGFDALDITNLDAAEFGAALRRFREGGVRVLVTTGALERGADWPEIPVVASVDIPERVELLHRRMQTASGEDAKFMLVYEDTDETREADRVRRERAALTAALDTGQMLALHAAAISGERLSYCELSRRTGLHPGEIRLGIEALIHGGSVRPLARGDDWIRAEAGDRLTGEMLERWGRHASQIRHARLARTGLVPQFLDAAGCRRAALADALDYHLSRGECRCDRCKRRAPVRIPARSPGGYPLRIGNFRGWALALYRRPGDDVLSEGIGGLMEQFKYSGDEGCGRRLAWLMHRRARESRTYRDCELIVAVPPSTARDDSPAELLAHEIARLSDLPLAGALRSAKEREPQKELTSE
ncbi:MAG: helicase-related protein, partial [Armatimonadota bacterium]